MKNKSYRKKSMLLTMSLMVLMMMNGCGQSRIEDSNSEAPSDEIPTINENEMDDNLDNDLEDVELAKELYVTFGDNGSSFLMHLYDNETAATIAKHVGTADWRLPIYNYDSYDNWEVMQYYDIPTRYDIPSNPETVTSQQSGTVYYSQPNRIVLFFGDANIAGEYTPVGYFDATDEFVSAVQTNPVLEGWSNKIIKISADE